MSNLNINELRNPALREFFEEVFDGSKAVEGVNIQAEGKSIPVAFTAIAPVNAVAAAGVLTFTGGVTHGELVAIGDDIYEFNTGAGVTEGNIDVDVSGGATAGAAITALVAAIVASDTSGVGGVDGAGDTVVVTADLEGALANAIITTTDVTNASWGAAVLENGVDSTIAEKGQMFVDATYLYQSIATSTVSTGNWRRIAWGSAY